MESRHGDPLERTYIPVIYYIDIYWFTLSLITDDDVYLTTTDLLKEYVLNDTGAVFQGNYKQINAKVWNFAQVNKNNLKKNTKYIRYIIYDMILTIKLQNEHNRKSWIRFKTNNNDTLFIVYAWYRILVNMIYVFYKYTGFKHVGWYNSSDTKKKLQHIYV